MRRLIRETPWPNIAAGGVAVGTVVAAYKLSNGMEGGLLTVARENPEVFMRNGSWLSTAFMTVKLLVVLTIIGFAVWLVRRLLSVCCITIVNVISGAQGRFFVGSKSSPIAR